jgi:hypothetical protein
MAIDVEESGNGLKHKPGRRRVSVPLTCWWEPALGPWQDPKAMLAAYTDLTLNSLVSDRFRFATWKAKHTKGRWIAATRQDFVRAAEQPPGSRAWYMAVCRDGATPVDYWDFLGYPADGLRFAAFPTSRPPQARPTPHDLALYATGVLDLPAPVMDRNPKLAKVRQASVVGFPTWFWVTNPAATGAPTATRSVQARAGNVRAEVTATATGVTITSDAGKTSCTPKQASTAYRPGISDASACTLTFTKASVDHRAGWPVTVTVSWRLLWTGTSRNRTTGGDLGVQPHTWTTTIPVAEIQTIVNGVRQ